MPTTSNHISKIASTISIPEMNILNVFLEVCFASGAFTLEEPGKFFKDCARVKHRLTGQLMVKLPFGVIR